MDAGMTEVLRIIIEAQDHATATLKEFSHSVDGMGAHTAAAAKAAAEGFALMGSAAAAALVVSVKAAADFQSTTQQLANNTNLGAVGLDAMRQASLKLAAQTGLDVTQIAAGYMHVANHAYDAAAAFNITAAAARNAAAVGGNVEDTANILGGVLREFNVSASALAANANLATQYMDVLHNAVANSNWTMQQFAEGSKKALAQAAAFGVPISQVSAQLATLSEHGFPSVANASLNWAGMLRSLESPTKKALAGMAALSRATGIDLVGDVRKLQQNGAFLPQFLADIQKATGGDFNKVRSIMPQSSYATALEALVRNLPQLQQILRLTSAAQAGQSLPGMTGTNEAFAAQQKTLNGQLADLRQSLNVMAIQIGTAVLPVLTRLAQALTPIVARLADFVGKHPQVVAAILAITAGVGSLSGALLVAGPALAALSGPLGLLVAGGAALYLAWRSNFGGIQQVTQGVWNAIWPIISKLEQAFSQGGLTGLLKLLGGAIKDTVTDLPGTIPVAISAAWSWASDTAKTLQDWLNTHGDEIKKDVNNGVHVAVAAVTIALGAAWKWATTTLGDLQTWLNDPKNQKELQTILHQAERTAGAPVQAVTIGLQATWAWARPYLEDLKTWITAHFKEIAPGLVAAGATFSRTGNVQLALITGVIAIAATFGWADITKTREPLNKWIPDHIGELMTAEGGVAAALVLRGMPVLRTISGIIAIAAAFGWAKNANLGPIQDWVKANASDLIISGGVSLAVLLATRNTQLASIAGVIAITASYAWDRPDGKPSDLSVWVNEQLKRGRGKAIDALDIFSAIGASVDDPKNNGTFEAWAKGVFTNMVYWLGEESGKYSTQFSNALGGVVNAIASAFQSLPQDVYNIIAGRVKGVASIKDEITHYFADAGTWLTNAGGQLIKGLWTGMTNNPFFQKIMDFFNMLKGWWGKFGNFGVSSSGGSVSTAPVAYSPTTTLGGASIGQQSIAINVYVGEGVRVSGGTASQQTLGREIGTAVLATLLAASRSGTTVAGTFLPGAV